MVKVSGAVLLVVGAVGAYWWRWWRRHEWLETVRAQGCRQVPELPHVGVVTFAGVAMCLVAAGFFAAVLRNSGRLVSAICGVLMVVCLLGAVGGGLVLIETPTKAAEGLDGSGLPCPAG
ncbi:hypothetical protein [Kribbella sp. NPDC004536]|uniref:hypothetical protein n=1 Tax=Kribbella sp. NPDC004536 TaxID=3364106 RepID=UPI0036C6F0FF